jgi:uncharacterized phiE125 gp8 family phage protein
VRTSLVISTPPAVEPVSLQMLLEHARIDTDVTNDLLTMFLTVARQQAESYLGRALITQGITYTVGETWLQQRPRFWYQPEPIDLPRAPCQSVTSVTWRDTSDDDTVLDPSTYSVDLTVEPAVLRILPGTITSCVRHICTVYQAGYGDTGAAVDMRIINAILVGATFLYENRGDAVAEMPKAFEWLLDPLRLQFFGG